MSESDGEQAARSLALEQAYVHDVYEQCAERTVQGRHWPFVQEFLEKLEPGALVCDVGCGNGKYLDINHNIFKIGVDRCQRSTSIAREKRNEVLVSDNLELPFRDESFDAVLSIAVVHHFSTTDRRVRALKELARVLRIGGRLVISVWAMEQKHRKFESQDVLVPWPRAYCVNSSGSPIKPRGTSFNDRLRGKSAQTYLLSKRNSQRRGSNGKSYWIDPIFSPSPSTSSLSSPNETCYSFFRRALQKLAGGRRGSRAWFLENWQNGAKERRLCEHEDEDNVEDLPIELRRLEEGVLLPDRHLHHGDNLGVKSKSLSDILEAQRLNLVRSRSSVPGLCNAGDEDEPDGIRPLQHSTRLLEQRSQFTDVSDDTAMRLHPSPQHPSSLQVRSGRRDTIVQKQSSMNEEIMSIERLKERESTRRNITKQTSLNEELIYKDRPVLEMFKDSLYSGSATKRFQLLKNGLTNRIRQSTTNIEKVSGMSIKNGFVRILQSWTSTESPVTATTSTVTSLTTPTGGLAKSHESCEIPGERRSSREDSDSSKDGSLQSDTSIDSEDSFASVIYVPKKSPSPLLENHTRLPGCQLSSTSAPPSPRLKYAPEMGGPGPHRLKLMPVSPLLKQFPATSKSLPPPSPPGLSPQILNASNAKPFFAGTNHEPSAEPSSVPVVAIEEAPEPSPPPVDEITKTSKETKAPGDDEETRLLGLRQIKELLRQKPGFAARTRPAYPLVRSVSGPEPAQRMMPRLLEYELFNPETDDLDSDSSGTSSPESAGSVISVLGAAAKSQEAAAASKLGKLTKTNEKITKPIPLDKLISPVESTWNEEYNRHLIDLTDRLSENLIHDINQFCRKSKLDMLDEDEAGEIKEPTSVDSRYLLGPVQEVQQEQELDNNAQQQETEVVRKSSLGRRFGDSLESSDSTATTSESSQPESSGSRQLSTSSWSSRSRLCPQTRSASEETRSLSQTPGNRGRRLQHPSTSNGTLSGSSSQESLPSDQITYHQFYHVFREGELDQLIGKYVENLHVISSYYDHASWCIVAEKVQVWTI